ncbi:hypothetical protein [Hymenobacter persicinus]|uniref:T9SS type A sorting domain-containing protein n=1 Tax=Hymenobacter persicinus TaxID=2025506 RepID=A0A4Q5LFV3_9BACT|nr:hypothetical protein [Hymenobacter persicinus]RYU84311.1 hypothetical protein EWM57_01050 [Hymenobacter persicinus]
MRHSLLLLGLLAATTLPARAQWVLQPISFASQDHEPEVIAALDANTAWTAANFRFYRAAPPQVARTADGGATWRVSTVPVPTGSQGNGVMDLSALDANTAWIAVANHFSGPAEGSIRKTTDGGLTWTTQTTAAEFPVNGAQPSFVHFFDGSTGICGGGYGGDPSFRLFTSSNGGTTWTRVPASRLPALLPNENGLAATYARGNTIWISTSLGRVLRSPDRGLTWTVGSTGQPNGLASLAFRDDLHGLAVYAYNRNNLLLRTTDGGLTWTVVNYSGPLRGDMAVQLVRGSNTYFSLSAAPLLNRGSVISTDDGQTWTALETTFLHGYAADFASPTAGWVTQFEPDADGDPNGSRGLHKYVGTPLPTRASQPQAALGAYPNPSTDGRFRLPLDAALRQTATQMQVYDALGRLVLRQDVLKDAGQQLLDLGTQPAGWDLVVVPTPAGPRQQRVLVQPR